MKGEKALNIPNDPVMLLSYINTLLRDKYDNLDNLCASLSIDKSAVTEKLAAIDYKYDAKLNKFI